MSTATISYFFCLLPSLFIFLPSYPILLFRDGWLRRDNQILTLRDATDSLYLQIAGPQNESAKNQQSVGRASDSPTRFPLHSASHLKLQVQTQCRWKASPWKGFASKPGQISLSAYQPRIYSASLGYSLRELGIIAKVMTVMMSLYLAHVPNPLPHQPASPFNLFIHPLHITVHSISCQQPKRIQWLVSPRHRTVSLCLKWQLHTFDRCHFSTSFVERPSKPKRVGKWRNN